MENTNPPPTSPQYRGSFQELADARRVLKMMNGLAALPALPAEERAEVQNIRARAIRCIEAATAELFDTLDLVTTDPEIEDHDTAEPDDEGDLAWVERTNQTKEPLPFTGIWNEDVEDDEGGGDTSGDEAEPLFDKVHCRTLNALFGDGAGCTISDPDSGIEDQPQGGDCHGAHC
jgi:hypothetical protein